MSTEVAPAAPRRLSQLWRNTLYSASDHIWLLALWAVSTPVFIAMLGAEMFGVWVIVNAVIGLNGVMSFGFGEATVRFVAKYRATGDRERVRGVIESSAVMYLAVTAVFVVGLIVGAPWIADSVFDLAPPLHAQAVLALRIAALALCVAALQKTHECAINGFERFDVTARLGMVTRSFIILGNMALALLGFGLPALLAVTLVGLSGQGVASFLILRGQLVPGLRLLGWVDRALAVEILRFGAQSWLQILAGAMSNILDRFIVGALMGPAAAGVYAVCLQLAQQIHLLLYRGLAWLMPAASREATSADGDQTAAIAAYRGGLQLSLALVAAVAVPLYVLAPQLLAVWVGDEFAEAGTTVLRLLLIAFAAMCMSVPAFFIVNGAGFPAWNSAFALLQGSVILAGAILFLPVWGLEGIGHARLAALPAMAITLWALHRRALPQAPVAMTAGHAAALVGMLGAAVVLTPNLSPLVPARVLPLVGAAIGLSVTALAVVAGPMLLLRHRAGRPNG